MDYIGEKKIRWAFEEELGKIDNCEWAVVKPFIDTEFLTEGDLDYYIKPVRESLIKLNELFTQKF